MKHSSAIAPRHLFDPPPPPRRRRRAALHRELSERPFSVDETGYRQFYAYGAELARRGDSARIDATLDELGAAAPSHPGTLIALLGVCQGLFDSAIAHRDPAGDYALLEGWLVGTD